MAAHLKASFLIALLMSQEVFPHRMQHEFLKQNNSEEDVSVEGANQTRSEFAIMSTIAIGAIAWGAVSLARQAYTQRYLAHKEKEFEANLAIFARTVAQPLPRRTTYLDVLNVQGHLMMLVQMYSMCDDVVLKEFATKVFLYVAAKYDTLQKSSAPEKFAYENVRATGADGYIMPLANVAHVANFAQQVATRTTRVIAENGGANAGSAVAAAVGVAAALAPNNYQDATLPNFQKRNRRINRVKKVARGVGIAFSLVAAMFDPTGLSFASVGVSIANFAAEANRQRQIKEAWRRKYCPLVKKEWKPWLHQPNILAMRVQHTVEQAIHEVFPDWTPDEVPNAPMNLAPRVSRENRPVRRGAATVLNAPRSHRPSRFDP